MEKQLLRLLIIDESPDDAELVSDALRKAGYMLKTQRVQDAHGMQAELGKGAWDAIVSEHSFAHFNAQLAIDIYKRAQIDIPFIVMTRRISDDDTIKLMRAGAHDVIVKSSATRLPAAMEREIVAAKHRQAHARTAAALIEIEDKHRSLIQSSREAICYAQDGMHVDANRAYLSLFGFADIAALDGIPFLNLVDKTHHAAVKDFLRKQGAKGGDDVLSFTALNQQGNRFYAELSVSPLTIKGEPCQQIVVNDVSKRKAAEQKLQYLNQHDALTALHNRHYFLQELTKAVEQARSNHNSVLLYIDIDQLQAINNEFGLEAGDRLLLRLAKLFREKLRPEDILARVSGDEFGALLRGVERAKAETIAAEITQALKNAPVAESGKIHPCHCTVSVIDIDAKVATPQKALMLAHQAQRAAKGDQRAPAAADSTAPAAAPAAVRKPVDQSYEAWHRRIEAALAQGKFHTVFQPIVNLHAEASENYEVLVRMTGADNAVVSAGEFMSTAEESGQAQRIDRAVLRQVLEHLTQTQKAGKKTRFFLNISHWTLRDAEYLSFLKEQLDGGAIDGRLLVFEIDETTVLRFPGECTQFIQAAKRLGCEFAVDNFTLASLQFIRQQPFAYIKLSGALMQNIESDEINQLIMQTISRMAKTLRQHTVAKHVESAGNLTTLWTYEIDYVQGHYFQAPEPALSYDFNIETVSSDQAVAGWISR